MNLTISEIAKIAQVSKGTVSKALNNYPGINPKTRQRILSLVEEMGYEPNAAAQALAFRRTGNIGLVIPHTPEHSLEGAYWSSVVTSVAQEVVRRGYRLSLMLPQEEGHLEELFRSVKRRQQYDGLVVGSEVVGSVDLEILRQDGIPFVLLGGSSTGLYHSVDIDNLQAARMITNHLLDQGYRRICLITGPVDYSYNTQRGQGYLRALEDACNPVSCLLPLPYNNVPAQRLGMQQMLGDFKPDALICGAGGDFMFEALGVLKEAGLSIPQTGFATFDDYRYLDFTTPRITAVQQPVAQIAAAAVQILVKLVEEPERAPPTGCMTLSASLHVRDSCLHP